MQGSFSCDALLILANAEELHFLTEEASLRIGWSLHQSAGVDDARGCLSQVLSMVVKIMLDQHWLPSIHGRCGDNIANFYCFALTVTKFLRISRVVYSFTESIVSKHSDM